MNVHGEVRIANLAQACIWRWDRQTDGQPCEECGLEHLATIVHAIESVCLIKQAMFKGQFPIQQNLFVKDTLNKGHLSNEDTVCCPNHIELCTNLPLN